MLLCDSGQVGVWMWWGKGDERNASFEQAESNIPNIRQSNIPVIKVCCNFTKYK